ncbi:MAG: hypothetical protein AVDCRST_MAG89-5231 [uncultured Gemmatimonadetes bacterium]|uniref:Uncharacterized protein n=1 Tax=uncultured Gemmatimonadota bacterium TaxID=203437 RepID=A0A6J4NAY2_9BACT|nr:MAG: hypothetical protein AVDCRST_MAG89-5231 [uncultured Gemmatimonadota bacterium]
MARTLFFSPASLRLCVSPAVLPATGIRRGKRKRPGEPRSCGSFRALCVSV